MKAQVANSWSQLKECDWGIEQTAEDARHVLLTEYPHYGIMEY
jgi:hypothetical protein